MIKDKLMRVVFIPLLGIVISYASGIVSYSRYTTLEIIGSLIYFVFVSFSIWRGCQWIHLKLRQFYTIDQNPFLKIAYVCMISGLYGIAISGMLGLIWLRFSKESFSWTPLIALTLFSLLAIIVFTLVYEILYLSKERKRGTEIVKLLDQELTRAEMMALRNELDPHFIFNSLTALSYLISNDAVKANLFNRKLAEVYKYFLINKEKELTSVENEIDFLKDYFFLLTIRHDNKLELHLHLGEVSSRHFLIIPCALQILIENAIKHNQFSFEEPLHIYILMDEEYLIVKNNSKRKQSAQDTTKIGLKNLSTQYRILAKKNIIVEESENNFIVKLPLIRAEDNLQS